MVIIIPGYHLALDSRLRFPEIVKTTSSAPATTPQVDWAKWKATIKTPGVVDDFQAAFGKLSVPAMEDTFTAKVEADFAAAVPPSPS